MRLKDFLTLQKLEQAEGDLDQEVAGLVYDSRRVTKGDVFFAVPGEQANGHQFVNQAIERGAIAAVVPDTANVRPGVTFVRVHDVRATMALWAAHFYAHPGRRLKIVGVTGTNGKTTTTYLIESILASAGLEPGVIGTINYRYGGKEMPAHHTTPESLDIHALMAEMAQGGARSMVMEVSSHALVQERVRGVDFDVGVFTNLSRDHLDYHKNMDDYFLAKSRLFTDYLPASAKSAKAAVVNGDDARGRELLSKAQCAGVTTWSYGSGEEWDIKPLQVHHDVSGQRGKIKVKDRVIEFSSELIGSANFDNILAAVGVGFALRIPVTAIVDGIRKLRSRSRALATGRELMRGSCSGGLCSHAGCIGENSRRSPAADRCQSCDGFWLRRRPRPRQTAVDGRNCGASQRCSRFDFRQSPFRGSRAYSPGDRGGYAENRNFQTRSSSGKRPRCSRI